MRRRRMNAAEGFLFIAVLTVVMLLGTAAAAYAGSIAGTVSGGGAPLADSVYVYLYTAGGDWVDQVVVGPGGAYQFGSLADGSYVVWADPWWYNSAHGTYYRDQYFNLADSWSGSTPVVVSGDAVTGIDFDLVAGGVLTGIVSGGGNPLADNIEVGFYDENGTWLDYDYTDASGVYTSPPLPAGSIYVQFWAGSYNAVNDTDFLGEFYQDVQTLEAATPLTITAGAATSLDVELAVGGRIAGTITGGGSPLADDGLAYLYSTSGEWLRSCWTDGGGNYAFSGLLPGDYVVAFEASSYNESNGTAYLSEFYDNVRDWDSALPVTAVLGTPTLGIDADLEVGGSISGTVVVDGTPTAAGVLAIAYNENGDWISSDYTDADGLYAITTLAPGDYRVYFSTEDFNVANGTAFLGEYYSGVRDWDSATPVTVALSTDTPGINADLKVGGSISGTITGDGTPIDSDVEVRVYDSATGDYSGATYVDAGGAYTISGLYAGDYDVFFDPGSYNANFGAALLPEWYDGAQYADDATPVTVALEADTAGIDADLVSGGAISGTVTGNGGALADNVYAVAYDVETGDWMGSAYTDSSGFYQVSGLYAGDYHVFFAAEEYNSAHDTSFVSEWYDDAHLREDATPVSVSLASDTPNVDADLAIGGTITGTVTADGGPVADISVIVFDAVTGDWLDDVSTATDGTYAIRGLYAGDYKVEFDAGWYNYMTDGALLSEYYDNVRYFEDATPVTADFATVTAGIDADLEIGGSISGTVDGDGTPVSDGVLVQVYEAGTGNWMGNAYTGPDGTYTVAPLYAGEYVLEFDPNEYNYNNDTGFVSQWYDNVRLYSEATPVAVEVGTDTPGIDANLAVGGSISGTVTGDGGVLEGVSVYAWDTATGDYGGDAYTDVDGTYTIRGLWGGDYNVGFSPHEYNYDNSTSFLQEVYSNVREWDDASPVAVILGEDTSGIDADLEIGAALSGTVTGDGDAPLSDVVVSIRDEFGRYVDDVWTDDAGDYAFWGIEPGDYFVQFDTSYQNDWYGKSYVREFWNDALAFADADVISLGLGDVADGIDAQLTQGGAHVSGTAYDSDGMKPLSGIGVGVVEEIGGQAEWISWTYTGSDGTYDLGAVPEGEFFIDFWEEDGTYKEMLYPAAPWGEYDELVFADPIAIPAAGTVSGIDAVMVKPATLLGSVVDSQSVGIGGIDVDVWYDGGTKGWHVVHQHETQSSGDYSFEGGWCGLLPGTYKVQFSDSVGDLGGAWYLNSPDARNATTFTVDAAGEVTLDPQLLPLLSSSVDVLPIAGSNRIATAIEASKEAFPTGAGTVVIATGYNWPDALGGAALAGAVDGPVLLTDSKALPAEVAAEVTRLGASKAYILGGTSAVNTSVENSLKALFGAGNVVRLSGSNRYSTAAIVASETVDVLGPDFDGTAFVATGANFPDALGASPLAAAQGWPIYLVNPLTGADAALVAAMQAAGVDDILPLGGISVISATIENNLKAQVPCGSTRLSGDNRYETALAVAQYGVTEAGMVWNTVAIATGQNFPDALAGGVLQGKSNSVMLLTPPTVLYPDIATTLSANKSKIWEVRFLGGTSAVSAAVRAAVTNALATP